ncbi:MAG TPA: glycosyltransferase [Dehalococcoidia bacterium]|nr:glycosyltransferase [Dehalococcoidia bacterium]
MKILFLRRRCEGLVGAPGKYHEFEQAVGKLAECQWAGEGWPLHKPNEFMNETVKRVMPDADWVFDRDDGFNPPSNRHYKVGAFLSDLHGKWSKNIQTPRGFVNLINTAGYDAVFLKYLHIYGTSAPPDLFLKSLNPRVYFLPWSVDPDKFKPLEKTIDAAFLGRKGPVYPLRNRLWRELPQFCGERRLRLLMREPPKLESFKRKISDYKGDSRYIVGEDYEKTLGQTRMLLFGSSRYRYAIQKYTEGASTGCLVMADEPSDAAALGLVDGETYVTITATNWKHKLDYYLGHPSEAERIAGNGRRLILERHTHRHRAEEFLRSLEDGL